MAAKLRLLESMGLIASALAVLLTSIAEADQTPDHAYMRVGENALPPIEFVSYCDRKPARCVPTNGALKISFEDHRRRLAEINSEINRGIVPLSVPLFLDGAIPEWDDDVLSGACFTYVLTKRARLLDLGYPSSALLLAVAIIPSGEGHLVLVIVTDQGDFVLDNLRTSIVRWDQLAYRWIERSKPEDPHFWQTILPLHRPANVGFGGETDSEKKSIEVAEFKSCS